MKHHPIPYFSFEGTAREALNYYKEVFEGEITDIQTFGEADFESPPELDDHIMHARFKKDDLFFMVSDVFLNQKVTVGNNISLALELDSEEEIQKLYSRLKEKGTVYMELQDTFWGATFAKVKDAYGVIWDLNYEKAKSK
ncbi:VOC family protein [Guptibacillus hwajinpoensis]|uniref:Glyoxalase n=1 Tax=Guptibacillus hwajinpoensis TaxID=208199 RepID=A0A0J6CV74_9BACL|nr:VOC family protein [Alkalihalobacillus macyae]KMM37035.1 glyoxalase [Alkalihalobacillus macyae]